MAKHDIDVLDKQTGRVTSVLVMENTDDTIKWLSDHEGQPCMIDGLDRCEWEFKYLPDYPTDWRD